MIGYVAKDKDGEVYIHIENPIYDGNFKEWFSSEGMICITGKFPEFDSMSYTDEPIKVEIKLERV